MPTTVEQQKIKFVVPGAKGPHHAFESAQPPILSSSSMWRGTRPRGFLTSECDSASSHHFETALASDTFPSAGACAAMLAVSSCDHPHRGAPGSGIPGCPAEEPACGM
eukprot:scaffold27136_cov118-Isochrysis_galbana.AAC.4